MSLDLANHIVDVIMSYEDPSSSDMALKIRSSSSTDIQCHKLNRTTLYLSSYKSLFKCHDDSPFDCVFSLELEELDLTTFFKFIANPSRFEIRHLQYGIQMDIVWFSQFIDRFKEQAGHTLFEELYQSVLIDFSIKCSDDFEVVLNFSKHSLYLGKNVHFEFHFDMEGNFKSVNFRSYSYGDNYQREIIHKYKPENQLMAFHLLLSYYCHPLVHQELDSLLTVPLDLNDNNINNYENIVTMLKI